MDPNFAWYQTLVKPTWAPPSWLFGPVWTVLYVLIAITFGAVFYKTLRGQIPLIVALPFLLNLVFNFAFTPLQFGLRNNFLASVDILLVLATIIWGMWAIYSFGLNLHLQTGAPTLAWIIYLNIPYLLWVSFATVLQITVTWLNWR